MAVAGSMSVGFAWVTERMRGRGSILPSPSRWPGEHCENSVQSTDPLGCPTHVVSTALYRFQHFQARTAARKQPDSPPETRRLLQPCFLSQDADDPLLTVTLVMYSLVVKISSWYVT